MSYLYINNQGSTVAVDGGYFTVTQPDGLVKKIPSITLEYIAAFGNIHFTTKAIQECIRNGVIVNFFSKNGTFFGKIESANNVKIGRQRQQFKLSGKTDFALELSKRIISAKIHNQLVVLGRYADNKEFTESFKQIKLAEKAVVNCSDINELLGHEGNAAKNYFYVLGNFVEEEFKFNRRTRQPPKDAFNSMLSFGYTLIMHETYGAILGKGMSPYAGFLHQDHEKHPTLASDLMEEWRPVLIDSLVLSLVQGHEICIKNFYTDDETGAVLLDKTAFSTFIKKYFVVICYDICDNKKRRKLVKYLEKYAVRVQKSVFEGYLTKKNYTKLKNGISGYISEEDSLRIYKLTGNGDVLAWGSGDIPENEDYIII